MRGRARAGPVLSALLAAASLSGTNEVAAQSWRTQTTWVAGTVAGGLFGAELRRPLGSGSPLPLPGSATTGPVAAPSRRWHMSGMLAAGVNAAAPTRTGHRVGSLAYAHAGMLSRTGRAVPGYVGMIAAAYLPAGVIGPAAYLEAADVAGLQLGALHGDGAWRGHVAVTVSIRFIGDVIGG